jgi:hypothetical protein
MHSVLYKGASICAIINQSVGRKLYILSLHQVFLSLFTFISCQHFDQKGTFSHFKFLTIPSEGLLSPVKTHRHQLWGLIKSSTQMCIGDKLKIMFHNEIHNFDPTQRIPSKVEVKCYRIRKL